MDDRVDRMQKRCAQNKIAPATKHSAVKNYPALPVEQNLTMALAIFHGTVCPVAYRTQYHGQVGNNGKCKFRN
jgi:hypothetical protein